MVAGGGNVFIEVKLFIALCSAQKLNPFIKEAHLIKYGSSPATMVASKDVYQKEQINTPNIKEESRIIV
ncbi:MAG: recombinase RecT [Faecalibacillus faecis]